MKYLTERNTKKKIQLKSRDRKDKKGISKEKNYGDKLFIFFHFYYPSRCHGFYR